jgi:hypothetical protein
VELFESLVEGNIVAPPMLVEGNIEALQVRSTVEGMPGGHILDLLAEGTVESNLGVHALGLLA